MRRFPFALPGNDCTNYTKKRKQEKHSRRSRPPKACVGVLNTVISWKSKMKSAHTEYI